MPVIRDVHLRDAVRESVLPELALAPAAREETAFVFALFEIYEICARELRLGKDHPMLCYCLSSRGRILSNL
jgi:hypothetical protein